MVLAPAVVLLAALVGCGPTEAAPTETATPTAPAEPARAPAPTEAPASTPTPAARKEEEGDGTEDLEEVGVEELELDPPTAEGADTIPSGIPTGIPTGVRIVATSLGEGQPEIDLVVTDAEISDEQIHALQLLMEQEAMKGQRFEAGASVHVGWLVLKVEEHDGRLRLNEPDFASETVTWVPTADHAVRQLASQLALCAHAGVEPQFPLMTEQAVAQQGLGEAKRVGWQREPSAEDSGVVVFDRDRADSVAEEARSLSLYDLIRERPDLAGVLALPPGLRAQIEGGSVQVLREDTPLGEPFPV